MNNIAIFDQEVCWIVKQDEDGVILRPTHSTDEDDDFWVDLHEPGLTLDPDDAEIGAAIDAKF